MEEDAGKLLHEGFADSDRDSYVDLNRAGTPLIEIVTEPDLTDGGRRRRVLRVPARAAGRARRQRRQHGRGQSALRRERVGAAGRRGALGTKAEIKNLNSFRFLEKAIEHEIDRQIDVARSTAGASCRRRGSGIRREERTVSMRSKEEAHDYRYFPEPDLPPLVVDAGAAVSSAKRLPELPAARRQRLMAAHGFTRRDVVHADAARRPPDVLRRDGRAPAPTRRPRGTGCSAPSRAKMNEARRTTSTRLRERLAPERLAGLLALVEQGHDQRVDGERRVREDVRDRAARR